MQDVVSALNSLKRPRLLIRAARAGQADYRREPHLLRLLGCGAPCGSGAALVQLMEIESELNRLRQCRNPEYSPLRHVDVLIALMGEARILRASSQQ